MKISMDRREISRWLVLLFVGAGIFFWMSRPRSDHTVEGPTGRPFYVGTVIEAERFVLRVPEHLDDVPDGLRAAVCRNYRDFLHDVTLNPDLRIIDDPGLLRSAELLRDEFKGSDVALEIERLMLDENLTSTGDIERALKDDSWSDQDLDVAADYIAARAEPPSSDAEENFVVFEAPVTMDEAVIARLEVAPSRELIDEPSVNRLEGGIAVEIPDGSVVGVDTSLCWR